MAKYIIADHLIVVDIPESEDSSLPGSSYIPFRVSDDTEGTPIMTLSVIDEAGSREGMEEIGQFDGSGANTGVYRSDDGYLFEIFNIHGKLCASLSSTNNFATNTVKLYGDVPERLYGIGNALMITFAFSATYHHTLLLHSSVTMKDGKGYMFLGKSGTGKSTHSRMWLENIADTELLNDDNPALHIAPDGTATIYGTPWSGKTPCYKNKSAQAGAFVRIEQRPENMLRRHGVAEAFASILSSCSTMVWDKPSHNALCDTIGEALRAVPSYSMECRPDADAALTCYSGLTTAQ